MLHGEIYRNHIIGVKEYKFRTESGILREFIPCIFEAASFPAAWGLGTAETLEDALLAARKFIDGSISQQLENCLTDTDNEALEDIGVAYGLIEQALPLAELRRAGRELRERLELQHSLLAEN